MSDWQLIEIAPFGQRAPFGWRDRRDGAWCVEVWTAEWGWQRDDVSNVSKHGAAPYQLPLPLAPDNLPPMIEQEI